jgi:hypothetical protein
MDDADPPSAAHDGEPGVLGNLPTTRPQHRSARRGGAAPASREGTNGARPPAPTGPARRRPTAKPAASSPATTSAPDPAPAKTPDVPAPAPAPRSGWATPVPNKTPPAPLPPLVALADGAVRTGAQLVRGVLRRLSGN